MYVDAFHQGGIIQYNVYIYILYSILYIYIYTVIFGIVQCSISDIHVNAVFTIATNVRSIAQIYVYNEAPVGNWFALYIITLYLPHTLYVAMYVCVIQNTPYHIPTSIFKEHSNEC